MPQKASSRAGGKLIVDALIRHGVDRVFCVPGESYLEVLDALYDARNTIDVVTTRHENGAANMAEAHAKLTGKVGVAMVTRGPGACNASIGVHTAKQDSTPMILLVGQIPLAYKGREAFQEVDYIQMFAPLAKWAVEITDAATIPEIMAKAFQVARSGRPGPVVISLPEDMQHDLSDADDVGPLPVQRAVVQKNQMAAVAAHLRRAARPLVIVGGSGWSDEGRRALTRALNAWSLPAATSYRRHDILNGDAPSFVGELGTATSTDPKLAQRVRDADVILAVNTRLGEISTHGYKLIAAPQPKQALLHIYSDGAELGRVFKASEAIAADPNDFAQAMSHQRAPENPAWGAWARDARADHESFLAAASYPGDLDLGKVMVALRERLTPDAVVTADSGNFSGWAQRFITYGNGRRFLASTAGAMGYGVPAAVAASLAYPGRLVIGCVGDGGFGMTGQELATAVMHGATPIILVFNNNMYGTIRMHQEREHPDRVVGTGLKNPDFAAIAVASGAHGETVRQTKEFIPAFERARAANKAALIELQCNPDVISTRTTLNAVRSAAIKRARQA